MVVHTDRMRANLEITCGALFSQRVLLALVEGGMARDDAYRIVQRLAQQAWDTQTPLRELLAAEEGVELDLDAIFDYGHYIRHVPEVIGRLARMSDPVLIYGAPEALPDLFHAIPVGDQRPVPLPRGRGPPRRRRGRAGRRAGRGARHRGARPVHARARRADRRRRDGAPATRPGWRCAACRELGITEALVPAEFPLGLADLLRRGGVALIVVARHVRRAPPGEDAGAARGHPARAEGGRRRDGRRRGADPRAAAGLTAEGVREAMAGASRRARRRARPTT